MVSEGRKAENHSITHSLSLKGLERALYGDKPTHKRGEMAWERRPEPSSVPA